MAVLSRDEDLRAVRVDTEQHRDVTVARVDGRLLVGVHPQLGTDDAS